MIARLTTHLMAFAAVGTATLARAQEVAAETDEGGRSGGFDLKGVEGSQALYRLLN